MADSGDRSVGINLSCRENIVNTLANVRNSIKDSTKDLKYFQEVRKEALEKKTKLEIDIKEAQSNLKNLEKTIKDGSEEGKKAWADQKKSLEQYKSELKSLNQLYKDAEKGELNLTQSINKNANNRSIQEQGSSNLTMAGMGKLFLAGEIGNYLKDTTTQLALGQITRRYGGSSGEMASSVAGDALGLGTAGAMGGFAVGGPWGAAIGGAGGLIIGGVGGYLKGKEKQEVKIDDQFRDIVQSNLQEININQAQQSQVGRDLARIVEKDKISFGTLIGNQAKADKWLNNDVVKFGAETPFEQPDIKNLAKIMLGYNVKLENVIPMLKTVGDASSALGMSKENRDFTAVILGRMNQGGKAQWADINMLQDRAIPAMKYLTEALGKSYEEVKEGLSKGAISNEKALQIILKGMEKFKYILC